MSRGINNHYQKHNSNTFNSTTAILFTEQQQYLQEKKQETEEVRLRNCKKEKIQEGQDGKDGEKNNEKENLLRESKNLVFWETVRTSWDNRVQSSILSMDTINLNLKIVSFGKRKCITKQIKIPTKITALQMKCFIRMKESGKQEPKGSTHSSLQKNKSAF